MAVASFGVALAASGAGAPIRHLDALRRVATSCELAGVELLLVDGRPPPRTAGDALEPFSILAALAAETSSLALGALVAADERAPSILAKATSTLDVCSQGRAVLVLAPSRVPAALAADGGLLGECVAVAQAMLTEPSPTFAGRHVAVLGAWNEPRAFASPPPVAAVLAATAPEEAGRLVTGWRAPPAFVLAEDSGESRPSEVPVPGAASIPRVPVLRFAPPAPAQPGDGRRRGAFDGLVVRFDGPDAATPSALGRLREAASASGG